MKRKYITPAGQYSRLYADMLDQSHLLIAGATGAGKTSVVNGIIQAALYKAPCDIRFILIDPKGTELIDLEDLPHTILYTNDINDCVKALEDAWLITKSRFDEMRRNREKEYEGSDIYIIIDEMMFLFNRPNIKKRAMSLLQDILVIARSAHVHCICCTQSPTEKTGLPVNLRCNFDSRVALRTSTAQDSRNIIGFKGCENFPNPRIAHEAYAYYMHGGELELYKLQKPDNDDLQRLIKYWHRHRRGRII